MDEELKMKIMVVDDEVDLEQLIRQKFRRQIREGVYDFEFAHNGLEALAKLIEQPEIRLILSDINMPEMDGLTLLTKLKELKNPGLKTVIVSAYGDMENIRTAMNRGLLTFSQNRSALMIWRSPSIKQSRRSPRYGKVCWSMTS